MVCPALLPITRALLPLSDRLSPKTTSESYMLAEAGGAVNETTATAIKGKNLLNAYFMKLPTLFTKLFRIAPCRAKCVNSSIICCSAFVLLADYAHKLGSEVERFCA